MSIVSVSGCWGSQFLLFLLTTLGVLLFFSPSQRDGKTETRRCKVRWFGMTRRYRYSKRGMIAKGDKKVSK